MELNILQPNCTIWILLNFEILSEDVMQDISILFSHTLELEKTEDVLIEIQKKDLLSLVKLRTVTSAVDNISLNNLLIGQKAKSFRRRNLN